MNKEHKKSGLSLRAVLLYISLCTFVVIGVTFSKYIASTTVGDGARVVKFEDISLTENVEPDENGKREFIVAPGVDIKKSAVVDFGGAETAVCVFVEITVDDDWAQYDEHKTFYALQQHVKFTVDKGWNFLEQDGKKFVYYKLLAPNEKLEKAEIISGGTISADRNIKNSDLKKFDTSNISFKAFAAQTDGRQPQNIWKLVKE